MERWRSNWRVGFAPVMPTEGLVALRQALLDDDQTLIQGATTTEIVAEIDFSQG